jgi:hypothetical protein
MAIEKGKLQIEKHKFDLFMKKFKAGKCGTQRLGQAFYDEMKLDRLQDQEQLKNLYAKDGEHALACIKEVFKFT